MSLEQDNDFLKTEQEIKLWLKQYKITDYTINDDLTVDVNGDVNLGNKNLKYIPVKFNHISGNFNCIGNQLNTLEFAPKKVGKNFICPYNQLTSLEFCPKEVGGGYYFEGNCINSLEFSPKIINKDFDCSRNELTSLEFAPEHVNGNFYCHGNHLSSLEFAPINVGGYFRFDNNPFINENYNNFNEIEIKKYLKEEESAKKLQDELYFHNNFRNNVERLDTKTSNQAISENNSVAENSEYINQEKAVYKPTQKQQRKMKL